MTDFGCCDCDFGTQDPVEAIPVFVPVKDQYGTVYDSPRDAARRLDLRGIDVERNLAGKVFSVKGYHFSFA